DARAVPRARQPGRADGAARDGRTVNGDGRARHPGIHRFRGHRGCRPAAALGAMNSRWLAVARGDEPADLVLSGGQVFSVFTKEWLETDVAVKDGHVVGLGRYEGRERI